MVAVGCCAGSAGLRVRVSDCCTPDAPACLAASRLGEFYQIFAIDWAAERSRYEQPKKSGKGHAAYSRSPDRKVLCPHACFWITKLGN